MTSRTIMFVGGPDTGKTNYLARLWLGCQEGGAQVQAHGTPADISYVETLVAHLMQGEFAPRSNADASARPFSIEVLGDSGNVLSLVIPDVTGELWKEAVLTSDISQEWMQRLNNADAALLFVRVHSDQIVAPLDWVATQAMLGHQQTDPAETDSLPTQVMLCELLRFLEEALRRTNGVRPRVAVLVTAWDLLDSEQRAAGPMAYLQKEFPLFWGRLQDCSTLDIATFGVSILGGDLSADSEFRSNFLGAVHLDDKGYVVRAREGVMQPVADTTLPLSWLLEA